MSRTQGRLFRYMPHNSKCKCNGSALLRLQIKCADYVTVAIFLLICSYILYEVDSLSSLDANYYLSAWTYLLHFLSQPSSYYLLYMPIMIVMLSRISDLGPYELMVYPRNKSRTEYIGGKLLAIVYYIVFSCFIVFLTSIVVFSCVSVPNKNWMEQITLLDRHGRGVLQEELLNMPMGLIIVSQIIMLMLSFIALGYFLVFLQTVLRKKNISIIVCFGIDCFLLLGTKSDLPKWLFPILPYQYLFSPLFKSTSYVLYAIAYWLLIISGLLLMIIHLNTRKDLFFSNL